MGGETRQVAEARPRSHPALHGYRLRHAQPGGRVRRGAAGGECSRREEMSSIDMARLDDERLSDLLDESQAELASREGRCRQNLLSELDHRVAAEGYRMRDLFPDLARIGVSATERGRRPGRFRNHQYLEETRAASGAPRGGCRRSSMSGESASSPSGRSRCPGSTSRIVTSGSPLSLPR